MEREKTTGALLGMAGGFLGLLFVILLFGSNISPSSTDVLSLFVLFVISLGFSTLFGSIAAVDITMKGKHPVLAGIKSSVLTNVCTILTFTLFLALIHGDIEILQIIPLTLLMSFVIGGIPMLIIGSLFGWGLKTRINHQKKAL